MKLFWKKLKAVGSLYTDGVRGMTWGRPLWLLIFLKLFILFAVLRVFFFKPVLAGRTDAEKSEFVGSALTAPVQQSAFGDSTGNVK